MLRYVFRYFLINLFHSTTGLCLTIIQVFWNCFYIEGAINRRNKKSFTDNKVQNVLNTSVDSARFEHRAVMVSQLRLVAEARKGKRIVRICFGLSYIIHKLHKYAA